MKRISIAAAAAGLLWVSSQAAADPGSQPSSKFYVGLDAGSSRLDASLSQQFFGPEISQHTGNDIGYRLRFGVQASRYFAAEVGFIDFGEFALRDIPYTCAPQQPGPCTFDLNSASRGPLVNIVVSWPFAERWALNGRVGGYYADITTSEQDPDVPGTKQEYHDSGIGFQIGAGLSFQINPRMKVSADWGKYDLIEFAPTLSGGIGAYDVGSASLMSLGFAYRF
jgi:opacity protein-like surface antigen